MGCCCTRNTTGLSSTAKRHKRLGKDKVIENYGATGNPIEIEHYGRPSGKQWYHGDIGDKEAERLMKQHAVGINGAFLVYDHPYKKDGYKLMAFNNGRLHSFTIRLRRPDLKYVIQGQNNREAEFRTVKELIHYHRGMRGVPIKLHKDETLVLDKGFKWK